MIYRGNGRCADEFKEVCEALDLLYAYMDKIGFRVSDTNVDIHDGALPEIDISMVKRKKAWLDKEKGKDIT